MYCFYEAGTLFWNISDCPGTLAVLPHASSREQPHSNIAYCNWKQDADFFWGGSTFLFIYFCAFSWMCGFPVGLQFLPTVQRYAHYGMLSVVPCYECVIEWCNWQPVQGVSLSLSQSLLGYSTTSLILVTEQFLVTYQTQVTLNQTALKPQSCVVQVTVWFHVGVSHEKQHSSPTECCVGAYKVKAHQ